MNADQLFERCTKQIDEITCEYVAAAAQQMLDAGANFDDLPRLMGPILQQLNELRADAFAKIKRRTATLRAIEHQIAVNEALIERIQNEAKVH